MKKNKEIDYTSILTGKNNKVIMRFKIYDKTAEKLTSLGCSYNSPGDPLSNLLLI